MDLDLRAKWVLAVGPFIALAAVLHRLPDPHGGLNADAWPHAIVHTTILFGLMAAHAACYRRWSAASPNRMLVNEFLTRIWFVVFGLLLVGMAGDQAPIFAVMAAPWAVASWCTHYLLLRGQGSYVVATNLTVLGVFLLGLALMGLIAVTISFG
jgi:hypothetical protein